MKRLALGTAALLAAVLVFVLLTLPSARLVLPAPAGERGGGRVAVRGAYHVHSTRSDGTGTVEGVAAAAARAGLQFVIFTEHGHADRTPDPPTYRAGVLCLDGVEISTDAGHYAALGLGRAPYPLAGEARDVIEDVARLGGFGIIAHPDSERDSLRWRNWNVPVGALEWLNADSEWRNDSPVRVAHLLLEYLFRKPEAIVSFFSRPVPTLARWDDLTRHGRVVGLAAHDAHARFGLRGEADPYTSPGGIFLGLPSYEAVFRAFSLGVTLDRPLTGMAAGDGQRLLAAVRAGHVHTVIDGLAGPGSFDFTAQADGATAFEGDVLPAGTPAVLRVHVTPVPGVSLVLLRAGQVVARNDGSTLEYRTDGTSGAYRAEAGLPGAPGRPPIPWMVGNPIYIGPPSAPAATPARALPTSETLVDANAAAWGVEHDNGSEAVLESGDGRTGQAVFRYRLKPGSQAGQYAALVHAIGGLPPFDRVTFAGRADRPMRLSVQLRQPGTGEGERWRRSVYLDATPREITIFLDDFRPSGQATPTHPALAALDSLLFVVDALNTPPGETGTVWFQGVRLQGGGQ